MAAFQTVVLMHGLVIIWVLAASIVIDPVMASGNVELTVGGVSAEVALEYRSFTADWCRHNNPKDGDRWKYAGMMTLDLQNVKLRNLAKALTPAMWRVGGSPEDSVVYVIGNPPECNTSQAIRKSYSYPGPLCLTMERWKEILDFVDYTSVRLVFGLNGLYQRHSHDQNFNSTNAREFLRYTSENFPSSVYAFELSNEDNHGQADPDKLAEDFGTVRKFINEFWPVESERPLLFGPDVGRSRHHPKWLPSFLTIADPYLNGTTCHSYCNAYTEDLCQHAVVKQSALEKCDVNITYIAAVVDTVSPHLPVLAGEVGPHSHGGVNACTNTFPNAFWYLQMLGSLSQKGVVAFARSTLIGGWYEMIHKTSFEPNPDYFLALFWGRLMGRVHLKTNIDGNPSSAVQGFASCQSLTSASGNSGASGGTVAGVTVALYNNGNSMTAETVMLRGLEFGGSGSVHCIETHVRASGPDQFSWHAEMLQSSGNWTKLAVGADGTPLEYAGVTMEKSASLLTVDMRPMSYAFVHFPTAICPSRQTRWNRSG